VKMGVAGARQLLAAGANDLGGTLMDEKSPGRPAPATASAWAARSSRTWSSPWAPVGAADHLYGRPGVLATR